MPNKVDKIIVLLMCILKKNHIGYFGMEQHSGPPGPDVGTGTGENGAWKVKLRISQDGNNVYQEFLITVINVNDAPTFTNSPNDG